MAIGIGVLVLIALISLHGPSDKSGARDGGPIVPLGGADGDDYADLGDG